MMSLNRRTFLKHTGVGLAAAAMIPGFLSCTEEDHAGSPFKNIGLQLFTLRDLIEQDAAAVLKNVAKIGYRHVETYGISPDYSSFWGIPVSELKQRLQDSDLRTYSGHYDLSKYFTKESVEQENIERYIEVAHELGQKYIIAPVTPLHNINKMEVADYQYMAEQLNKAGEMSQKAGIKMGFHNHFWEFREFGNNTKGLDIMIAFTEPDLVDFELDLFWTIKAGQNPHTYFEKYPNRFPLWHVKDMDRSRTEPLDMNSFNASTGKRDTIDIDEIGKQVRYAEVGYGNIEFTNIIRYGKKSGLQYAFVEQDDIYSDDKLGSIRKSYDYIKRNLANIAY